MSLTLTQIAANTATVAVAVMGDTINVTYFPNKFTDQLVAQIESGAIDDNQMFTDLIASWDIFEDDAKTTMLAISRIDELGIPIKMQIAQAITTDIRPKVATPA